MKTTRLSTLILMLALLTMQATAQSWRWGVSGGSSNNHWISNQTEYVVDMASDRNGNVYTITTVNNKDLNVAGLPKQGTTPSQPWQIDVMINSFNCSGQLRWSKVIGVGFSEDRGYALRTDSADGVYAAVVLGHGGQPSIRYMDADTLVHDTSYKQLWVVKYDTAGKFKWMDGPEQDTISSMSAYDSEWVDMDVDGQGNVHCLVYLPANVYCGGAFTAATDGEYIVRYDKDGVFKSAIRLETNAFDSYTTYAHLACNPVTNGYYLYGSNYYKFYLPGDSVTNGMFILEFDKDGKYLWKKENTVYHGGGFFGRAAFDASENIYLAGNSTAGNSFDWYTTTNGGGYRTPFIVKLDKAGNLLWAKDAIVKDDYLGRGVALRNSGEVVLIADAEYMRWPGLNDSVNFTEPTPTITRFNTQTGKVLGIESLVGSSNILGTYPAGTSAIIADGSNGVFVGGSFFDTLQVGSTQLASTGGMDDFFITRWGYDTCGCDTLLNPSFTAYAAGNTYQFIYTGLHPFQSILWDFGDGTTSTQINPSHNFAQLSQFDITVTVTNACGDNTFGGVIQTVGVNEVSNQDISIYPNPAVNELTIEGATVGSTARVFDISGRLYHTEVIRSGYRSNINTASLPPGQYLLKLSAPGKAGYLHRFVKQ